VPDREAAVAGDVRVRVVERVRPRDDRDPALDLRVLTGRVDCGRVVLAPWADHEQAVAKLDGITR
jgi:hypothetical protein